MRHRLACTILGSLALLAACERTPLAPVEPVDAPMLEVDALASAVALAAAPDRLPAELRLTPEQAAAIAALTQAFLDQTAADRAALETALRAAHAARAAGRPAPEVRAILAEALPARQRLEAARVLLRAAILEIYTPAQRAWIEERRQECDPRRAPPLTGVQRTQIAALQQAFAQANAADLALVKAVAAEARAAHQAGASPAEVRAILQRARPVHERLADAHERLRTAIEAILTPEQRAARCGLGGGR